MSTIVGLAIGNVINSVGILWLIFTKEEKK